MQSKYNTGLKIAGAIVGVLILGVIFYWFSSSTVSELFNPAGSNVAKKDLPYEKYSFEQLAKRGGILSSIQVVGDKFYYQSEGRRISGAINIPTKCNLVEKCPVIVMARGYAEKEGYKTGFGTKNSATVYAKNGYITLAPDFSGYGESDPEDSKALGARLTKPVEMLDLIASLSSLSQIDSTNVFLWGHSNGGQVMLSVAEILGKNEPSLRGDSSQVRGVTLWAPVSKPFPYNILYYTDDPPSPLASEGQVLVWDQGKALRKILAEFEKDYDVFDYSIDRYLDWINIPIQIHQGTADEAVPKKWSDDLVKNLKEKEKEINYYVYPGADHNMRPSWDIVVSRDIEWFGKISLSR